MLICRNLTVLLLEIILFRYYFTQQKKLTIKIVKPKKKLNCISAGKVNNVQSKNYA